MTARPSGSQQQPRIAPWTDRDAAAAAVLAINPGSSSLKAVLRSPAVALTAGIAAVLIDPNSLPRLSIAERIARVSSLDAVIEAAQRLPFP